MSQNDGTSKIIQDEVEKELEEMYIRQEMDREQRERILENMLGGEGNTNTNNGNTNGNTNNDTNNDNNNNDTNNDHNNNKDI